MGDVGHKAIHDSYATKAEARDERTILLSTRAPYHDHLIARTPLETQQGLDVASTFQMPHMSDDIVA